ncbi:MAG: histidine phosphatase family protein [Alphaproteobacteria bacterium]|jgi:probable phosphoglycerate mutase|nr:histidine phosphatase family protein [Alphaproteobacteria bacterium]MDP6831155.1 histidine phosphatase family protein [Alphaproteobacteria bacterium]MDP6873246.1 histidine phosphatase family protein [Alphaproteobacteria bacterium]
MTLLGMIRHGRTAWNGEGRLTGRTDIPLTEEGRAGLAGLRPPAELDGAKWHVSPLLRARQTAEILHQDGVELHIEPRLIEMSFGAYEGRTLEELRADPDAGMAANEDRGLDFLPPGGESPRMVQDRLRPFLADLGQSGGRHIAVAHKAVIRAVFAAAHDWNMMGRPPVKLRWEQAHIFEVDARGDVRPWRMNLPLLPLGDASQ